MSIGVNSQITNINNIQPKSQVAFRAQTTPIKDYPPDTVEIQGKKKGLSTGAKWGIGLGLTALTGIGLYLLTKGRIGTKPAKQIAEHVDFKPAKTVEEAQKFAQEKFGVQYHDINDVDVINGLNEWITGIHNKTKTINKGAYPKYIANNPKLKTYELAGLADGALEEGYLLSVNLRTMKNLEEFISSSFIDTSVIAKNSKGKYQIVDEAYNTEFVRNLIDRINRYNPKTATFKENSRLAMDIKGLMDGKLVNGKIKEVTYSDFFYLNHELGHLRHQEINPNYNLMKKIDEFLEVGEKPSEIAIEFASSKSIQTTAKKVSEYAPESPAEFIAETFAGLLEGKTYSDDVMALYKKYGGPVI